MFYEIESSQLVRLILVAIPVHAAWIMLSQRLHPLYLLAVVLLVLAPFSIAVDAAPVIVALKYARAYAAVLLLGVGVVMFLAQGQALGKGAVVWLLFSLYFWLSSFWGEEPVETFFGRFRYILLIGGGLLLGLTLRSMRDLRSSLRVLFFGSTVWSVLIVIGVAAGHFEGSRLAMFGMNANQVAMGCGFTFIVSITTALFDRRLAIRVLAYASCGVIGLGAVLTGSRAGVGALVLGAIPVVAAAVRRPATFIGFATAATIVAYVASGYLVSDYAVERLGSVENTRREVWAHALELAGDAPVFGRGETPEAWKAGMLTRFNTHSIYLMVLVTSGAIGLLALLAVVALGFAQHLRAWRLMRALRAPEMWPVWFSLGLYVAPLAVGVFEEAPLTGVSVYTLALGMAIGITDSILAGRLLDESPVAALLPQQTWDDAGAPGAVAW